MLAYQLFHKLVQTPYSHLGCLLRPQAFQPNPTNSYPYSTASEACAKFMAKFYPDIPQGVEGIGSLVLQTTMLLLPSSPGQGWWSDHYSIFNQYYLACKVCWDVILCCAECTGKCQMIRGLLASKVWAADSSASLVWTSLGPPNIGGKAIHRCLSSWQGCHDKAVSHEDITGRKDYSKKGKWREITVRTVEKRQWPKARWCRRKAVGLMALPKGQ